MEESEVKKQWHGPFCSAVRLELVENKKELRFENEYSLSTKPLQIDLLVIRMTGTEPLKNEIGKIFRIHNLLEYKSPGDALGIETYYKVLGYACFYKSLSDQAEDIDPGEITVSFVREGYPRELFRFLREKGFQVEKKTAGIYYITGETLFPMQVLVTKELDKNLHIWLTSLTRDLDYASAETLVCKIGQMEDSDDLRNAGAVLSLALEVNPGLFGKVKEGNPVYEAIEKFLKPSTDRKIREAIERTTVEVTKEVTKEVTEEVTRAVTKEVTREVTKEVTGRTRSDDVKRLMEKMQISLENACDLLDISVEEFLRLKPKEQ